MNNKFRLPTKEEFEHLSKCYTRFDEEKKCRFFFDHETCEEMSFPAEDFYGDWIDRFRVANYWSSSFINFDYACCLYFSESIVTPFGRFGRFNKFSVRLVSDEPFEGCVCVAGVFWKQENEEGFYTFDEAISKFENKE